VGKEMKHKLTHINKIFDTSEKREKEPEESTPIGFKRLYKANCHLYPGSFYVIAARPGMGKTAFALTIAKNFTKLSNKAVAYFTLGESNEQLVKRLLSIASNVDARKFHIGHLSGDEEEKAKAAQAFLRRQSLYFNDTAKNIDSIKRTLQGFSNLGLVIIDYVQLLSHEFKKGPRIREGYYIINTLEKMAVELNIPIIVTSQIPRFEREKRRDYRPKLNNLRKEPWDFLEPVAAVILFLYREAYYNGDCDTTTAECIIAKNRFGETGTISLQWNDECGCFNDVEECE
jgi:replicative DNA helicase